MKDSSFANALVVSCKCQMARIAGGKARDETPGLPVPVAKELRTIRA
jgi:hypothetical protein